MNLLDMVMDSQNNNALSQVAKNFGLGESETRGVVAQLLPMLAQGMQKNTVKKKTGLEDLFGALSSGNHQQYIDQPNLLDSPSTTNIGNSILGHIFGSKDVSRNVAAQAAQKTGISSSIIKKMLPVIATMAMGALSKNAGNNGLLGSLLSSGNNSNMATSMIGSLLDSDHDGSVVDDLFSLAVKLF